MKKIKNYKEFIKTNEAVDLPPVPPTEIHSTYEKPASRYSAEDTYVYNPSDTIHKVTKSKSEMEKMVKFQHWSLDSIQVDTVYNIVKKQAPHSDIKVITTKFETDGNKFITAQFEISQEAKSDLQDTLMSIINAGGMITDVQIESSTDKEPIKMTNEILAQKRADAVKLVMLDFGIDESIISIETKPEQGPDIYSTTMSEQERDQARSKTAEFRYVNVSIIYLENETINKPAIIDTLVKYKKEYYLSKPVDDKPALKFATRSFQKKQTSFKVKDGQRKGGTTKCEYFGNKGWWNDPKMGH
jgi:outer membrane protein OmpA-like peptidoglycan-associated protein